MLGRILAEWDDRPAGCLFLVPLWHPVLMAEQIGTLAAMASGPFVIQAGLGGGRAQFRAMGARWSDRGRLLEEGIGVVQSAPGRRDRVQPNRGTSTGPHRPPATARHGVVDRCGRSGRDSIGPPGWATAGTAPPI